MGPRMHLVLVAFLAEGGEQPLPSWMGTLDWVGLTATTLGFLAEGDACDGLFEN